MYNRINAIDLNGLLLFHALASSTSLRQASTRLRVPAATVSRKLRDLERTIGAVLFKRGPRQLTLTQAGTALCEHCERIVSEVEAAQLAMTQLQAEPRGEIRVSLPFGFGTDWVSVVIAKFALAYPRVELIIQATHRSVDITNEPIDVAFHVGPVRNQSLPAVKISELTRGVYASSAYCAARGVPGTPADLLDFDCIPLESQRLDGLWTFQRRARKLAAPARISVSDVSTAFRLVLAGLGVAILPNVLCQKALANGELRRVLPDWRIPPLPVTATYLERRHLPMRIRAFLDFVQREIRPMSTVL